MMPVRRRGPLPLPLELADALLEDGEALGDAGDVVLVPRERAADGEDGEHQREEGDAGHDRAVLHAEEAADEVEHAGEEREEEDCEGGNDPEQGVSLLELRAADGLERREEEQQRAGGGGRADASHLRDARADEELEERPRRHGRDGGDEEPVGGFSEECHGTG